MLLTRAVLIVSLCRVRGEPACSLCQQSTFWRNLLLVFAHSVSLVLGCCVALTQLWLHSSSFSAHLQVSVTSQWLW